MTSMIGIMLFAAGLLAILICVDFIFPHYVFYCEAISKYSPSSFSRDLWFLLALLLLIGLCWLLARRTEELSTINGCGAMLFGRMRSDQGNVATRWICIFYLAVLPVASYEVLKEEYGGTLFSLRRLRGLYRPQVLRTLPVSFLVLMAVITIPALIVYVRCS